MKRFFSQIIWLLICLSCGAWSFLHEPAYLGSSIPKGAASIGTNIPVDILFQWNGVNGAILTTNAVVASEIGSDKGVITYKGNQVITNTYITNATYTTYAPFNVGGTLYSNFNQSLFFDLTGSSTYEGIQWAPSGTYSNMSLVIGFTPNISGTAANYDVAEIDGGKYSIAEFLQSGGVGYFEAHGQVGTNSTKNGASNPLLNGTNYQVTLRHSTANQLADVMVVNAADNTFVGYGKTNTDAAPVSDAQLQDYLWLSGATGNFKVQYMAMDWTHAAMPLGPTPTIPIVTNLIGSIISSSNILISWNYNAYTKFIGERSSGGPFSKIFTNDLNVSSFQDTNIVVGNTYTYRVTSYVPDFNWSSLATTSSPVVLANCSTPTDNQTNNVLEAIATGAGDIYISGFVDPSTNTESICRIDLYLDNNNTFIGQATLEIWSYNSGAGTPGSYLGVASDPIPFSFIPPTSGGSSGWVSFNNLHWNKVAGTSYCFTLHLTGSQASINPMRMVTGNIGDPGHHTMWTSPDGTTWTSHGIVNLDRVWFIEYK